MEHFNDKCPQDRYRARVNNKEHAYKISDQEILHCYDLFAQLRFMNENNIYEHYEVASKSRTGHREDVSGASNDQRRDPEALIDLLIRQHIRCRDRYQDRKREPVIDLKEIHPVELPVRHIFGIYEKCSQTVRLKDKQHKINCQKDIKIPCYEFDKAAVLTPELIRDHKQDRYQMNTCTDIYLIVSAVNYSYHKAKDQIDNRTERNEVLEILKSACGRYNDRSKKHDALHHEDLVIKHRYNRQEFK